MSIVQVIHVVDASAVEEAVAVAPLVDAILLDSGNPRLAVKELGGTGRRHDWRISRRIVEAVDKPVWLAGGLSAANAAEAVAAVRPHGLDVCSGVRTDGRLDERKVAALFAAVAGVIERRLGEPFPERHWSAARNVAASQSPLAGVVLAERFEIDLVNRAARQRDWSRRTRRRGGAESSNVALASCFADTAMS